MAQEAVAISRDLIAKTPGHYSARYAAALAVTLLALLAAPDQQANLQAQAAEKYQAALLQCKEAGILAEEKRLLDNIQMPKSEGFINELKAILD